VYVAGRVGILGQADKKLISTGLSETVLYKRRWWHTILTDSKEDRGSILEVDTMDESESESDLSKVGL
jgi:hypothetical protein